MNNKDKIKEELLKAVDDLLAFRPPTLDNMEEDKEKEKNKNKPEENLSN